MNDFITEINFDSASTFLAALSPWTSSSDLRGYIFRGHSDDTYELIPSSIRRAAKDKFWHICGIGKPVDDQSEWDNWHSKGEYNLLREFYKIADRRGLYVPYAERVRSRLASSFDTLPSIGDAPEEWLPSDLLELAGLAQHYGLPTRLLDWSYDPLVSAYFAAASAKPGACLSVWALDADTTSYMNETVHQSPLRLVTPPYHGNPNLAAQSGIFTSWSTKLQTVHSIYREGAALVDRRSLDILMKSHVESHKWEFHRNLFFKFKLPTEWAPEVLNLLAAAGYDASRIFPGYSGVAAEVARRHQPLI